MHHRNNKSSLFIGFALVFGLSSVPGFANPPVRTALTRHGPLEADEQTTTLWRFGAAADRTAPDLSGHERHGRLTDGVELVPVPHALPGFGLAARMAGTADDALPQVVADEAAQPLAAGPFTVEVRLRFALGGGYWLQAGDRQSLRWGMLLRGAGYMGITGFAHNAEGQATRFDLMTHTLLKPIGPIDYERFYHYALSFDGQATFRVYVDGVLAWEARLPEGLTGVVLDQPSLRVGRPLRWESSFVGQIAEVRVSAAERVFEPAPRPLPQSLAVAAPHYRFDLGAAASPVADHHLPVTMQTRYTPERGYGWIEAPLADWDFWFAPGRYTSVPERSEAENSQGLLNDWQRDGLTVPDNATFRADIPPGIYAVRVTVGHPRRETQTQSLLVNGQPLGEHLKVLDIEGRPLTIRTSAKATTHQELRTARDVVTVGAAGLRVTVHGVDGEPVHLARIEATPWAEPLVQRVAGERALTWTGPGDAPAGFAAAAEAYAAARVADAVAG
ncbi:MAG: hypothetical protein K9N49_08780, partial [Candidatus Marinimicrobia bacterium]|nr:hypothetical protein [Candidatus Neomarinimicrobiota bacterium]